MGPTGPDLSEDQSGGLAAVFVVFTVLPAIALVLRIYARRLSNLALLWDDWLLVAAEVRPGNKQKRN
jgi:hypothetical protein